MTRSAPDDAKLRAAIEAAVSALVNVVIEATRAATPAAPPAEYLTTAGAATVAAVNEGTIRRWVRAGRIRGYRAGRVLRVRRDELDRMLATGRRSTTRVSDDESPEELALRAVSGARFHRSHETSREELAGRDHANGAARRRKPSGGRVNP